MKESTSTDSAMNLTRTLINDMGNTERLPSCGKEVLHLRELDCKNDPDTETLLLDMESEGLKRDLKGMKSYENAPVKEDRQDFADLDTGWAWVILFAAFLSFGLFGGSMHSVGIIHNVLLEHFQASVALTAWVGALHTGILSLGSLLSTAVVDRFSCRTAIICSGLIYTVGYMATAFMPCIEAAIFTCGIIVGIGGAFGYTAVMVVVGFNFKRRRNLALGISLSGSGIGLCAFAPILQMAKDFYGFSGFFICCACMQINLVTLGMLCFPSALEIHANKIRQRDKESSIRNKNIFKRRVTPYLNVLLNKGIVCLCLSMFLYGAGTYLLFLHLPKYITTKGFSEHQAAYLVSLIGILAVVGRILTGIVANNPNCNETIVYAGSMTIIAITTIVYPFVSRHYIGHIVFTISLGLFFGCCYVVTTTVSLKFVAIDYIATSIGLEFMCCGVGAVVGPVIAGTLVDSGGTYDHSVIVAGVCILMAAVCGAISNCFVTKRMDVTTTAVE
ncbi:monocarboxylate transporter 4-like [Mya arenaria]|uniref:monocarboxylate transporter 4-like n=1 Tax=Mya arenaria TaxID=6604 RepID=UPI0022E23C33|nr:monocarboxylate transporter 4-like [Mya arenaria]